MSLISLVYILDYCLNVKYELEYYKEAQPLNLSDDLSSYDFKAFNPEINISIKFSPHISYKLDRFYYFNVKIN